MPSTTQKKKNPLWPDYIRKQTHTTLELTKRQKIKDIVEWKIKQVLALEQCKTKATTKEQGYGYYVTGEVDIVFDFLLQCNPFSESWFFAAPISVFQLKQNELAWL